MKVYRLTFLCDGNGPWMFIRAELPVSWMTACPGTRPTGYHCVCQSKLLVEFAYIKYAGIITTVNQNFVKHISGSTSERERRTQNKL